MSAARGRMLSTHAKVPIALGKKQQVINNNCSRRISRRSACAFIQCRLRVHRGALARRAPRLSPAPPAAVAAARNAAGGKPSLARRREGAASAAMGSESPATLSPLVRELQERSKDAVEKALCSVRLAAAPRLHTHRPQQLRVRSACVAARAPAGGAARTASRRTRAQPAARAMRRSGSCEQSC